MNLPNFAESFFVSQGFECVKGENKKVFLVPSNNFVVKLPIDKAGSEHNFGEWNFFSKTRGLNFNLFLQPTFFSFRHFDDNGDYSWINIQQIGFRPCLIDNDDFTCQMLRLTNFEANNDQHHFYRKENFFFDKNGRLKIVDYGSLMTQEIVRKYGQKIYESFDEKLVFSKTEREEVVTFLSESMIC